MLNRVLEALLKPEENEASLLEEILRHTLSFGLVVFNEVRDIADLNPLETEIRSFTISADEGDIDLIAAVDRRFEFRSHGKRNLDFTGVARLVEIESHDRLRSGG